MLLSPRDDYSFFQLGIINCCNYLFESSVVSNKFTFFIYMLIFRQNKKKIINYFKFLKIICVLSIRTFFFIRKEECSSCEIRNSSRGTPVVSSASIDLDL